MIRPLVIKILYDNICKNSVHIITPPDVYLEQIEIFEMYVSENNISTKKCVISGLTENQKLCNCTTHCTTLVLSELHDVTTCWS